MVNLLYFSIMQLLFQFNVLTFGQLNLLRLIQPFTMVGHCFI